MTEKQPYENHNEDFASRAERVLFWYDDARGEVPSVDSITDLLTDLMHYCRQNATERSFDECLTRARGHFEAEDAEKVGQGYEMSVRKYGGFAGQPSSRQAKDFDPDDDGFNPKHNPLGYVCDVCGKVHTDEPDCEDEDIKF